VDFASPAIERCRLKESWAFRRTFTVIVFVLMSVITDFSFVSPRAFGVTGESMDEYNAFSRQYEMEA